MPSVVFANVLKGAGFGMILYLSAIQNIPQSLYEAAEIDGATTWKRFTAITLPLVKPITLFMVIIGTIGALNAFAEVYAMTSGGPNVDVGGPRARRDMGDRVLRLRHVLHAVQARVRGGHVVRAPGADADHLACQQAFPQGGGVDCHPAGATIARRTVLYVGLTVAAVVVLFPFFWMVVTAFKQPGQAFSPEIFPSKPTLENFRRVLSDYGFARYFVNSVIVATTAALVRDALRDAGRVRLREEAVRRARQAVRVPARVAHDTGDDVRRPAVRDHQQSSGG